MNKTYRVPDETGHNVIFMPGQDGIQWLGLEIVRLSAGEEWSGSTEGREALINVISGQCDIHVQAGQRDEFSAVGQRNNPFEGPGHAVYIPAGSNIEVKATRDLELAIASSPAEPGGSPSLIEPDSVKVVASGALNWQRDVRLIIPPGSPLSQRLIVGETLNPPGNWSGVPPHKHDEINAQENFLEEFYYFNASPPEGYGVQLMYTDGSGDGRMVSQGDVTVMLEGYHPTVAAPGTTLCYFWVLAGDTKDYDITTDPRFDWVKDAEAEAKGDAQ